MVNVNMFILEQTLKLLSHSSQEQSVILQKKIKIFRVLSNGMYSDTLLKTLVTKSI